MSPTHPTNNYQRVFLVAFIFYVSMKNTNTSHRDRTKIIVFLFRKLLTDNDKWHLSCFFALLELVETTIYILVHLDGDTLCINEYPRISHPRK